MAELERIKSILKRVFQQLEKSWEQQAEREEIEVKDQEYNTPPGQI